MTIRFAPVAIALAVAPQLAIADATPTETIIVTATRTEIPLSDAIVPVTVISREDIELSMAGDLAELLRFQAGIDIGRNGGPGQATSVFMRGTESNHTLVLIDGVRMNPGTLGGAAVQHISPEMIERIEIVKGARSALFGTDAIGGVINIITRRAESAYFETGLGAGDDPLQQLGDMALFLGDDVGEDRVGALADVGAAAEHGHQKDRHREQHHGPGDLEQRQRRPHGRVCPLPQPTQLPRQCFLAGKVCRRERRPPQAEQQQKSCDPKSDSTVHREIIAFSRRLSAVRG